MRRIITLSAVATCLLLLGACRHLRPLPLERQNGEEYTYIEGVVEELKGDTQGVYSLRSKRYSKTRGSIDQLCVSVKYRAPINRSYDRAILEDGQSALPSHSRVVANLLTYRETFSLNLPSGYLKSHPEGFTARVIGQRGDTLSIPVMARQVAQVIGVKGK